MKNKPDFDWKKDFSGFVGKDVVLSIGLPPAHFEKQRDSFKNYFLSAARYGLDFRYNDKSFSIRIKEIFVFPQDYAVAIIYKQDLIKKYGTVYCIEMVQCIIQNGRADLMEYYPVPLYEGENADANAISGNSKVFSEALTVELLEKHRALSDRCK